MCYKRLLQVLLVFYGLDLQVLLPFFGADLQVLLMPFVWQSDIAF